MPRHPENQPLWDQLQELSYTSPFAYVFLYALRRNRCADPAAWEEEFLLFAIALIRENQRLVDALITAVGRQQPPPLYVLPPTPLRKE